MTDPLKSKTGHFTTASFIPRSSTRAPVVFFLFFLGKLTSLTWSYTRGRCFFFVLALTASGARSTPGRVARNKRNDVVFRNITEADHACVYIPEPSEDFERPPWKPTVPVWRRAFVGVITITPRDLPSKHGVRREMRDKGLLITLQASWRYMDMYV